MGQREGHVCKKAAPVCRCYMLADEPSWDCEIHGGGIDNRCECGRFVRIFESPKAVDAVDPVDRVTTG
jgi:hypothetical protein